MKPILTRTLSGLVFLGLMLLGLCCNKFLFFGVFFVVLGLLVHEFYQLSVGEGYTVPRLLGIVTALSLFAVAFLKARYQIFDKWFLLAWLPLLLMWLSIVLRQRPQEMDKVLYLMAPLVYIALPFCMLHPLAFDSMGRFDGRLLLSLFILLWTSDVGAYLFGSTFGQKNGHKLCPAVSPNKSWEGVWGGLALALVAGLVLYLSGLLHFTPLHCLGLSLTVNLFSVLGDLFESGLKRFFHVKDSGAILPGHGGLLDRFDGALFVLPAAVVYLFIFNLL